MVSNGFSPEVPADARAEIEALDPARTAAAGERDLRELPWSSIDNDSSRDLDQLEVAESLGSGATKVRVAIADVAATVPQGSAVDRYASENATSVYTGVVTFPMLPDRLSTDLTSLGESAERSSVIIEFVVAADGTVASHDVSLATVTNHAKLAYGSVGAWLEGHGLLPPSVTGSIQDQLRLQDTAAGRLRAERARRGALSLETIEAQPVASADGSVRVELVPKTRANNLIEDFMIAANVAIAQFLDEHGSPSLRRVVRTPERWPRIVTLAATFDETLPNDPDSAALEAFLARRQAADPVHYPDLSLSVVKLLGPGEYVCHLPGDSEAEHFGLATHDYTHSTAPNRRYADLVTQRLLKAVLAGTKVPYSREELTALAAHCTEREDAARKVERQVRKEIAAASMMARVGEQFDAIVTGVTPKGTFVRLLKPPVEGRVMRGESGMDVGEKVRVSLIATDPARGFIDFARA